MNRLLMVLFVIGVQVPASAPALAPPAQPGGYGAPISLQNAQRIIARAMEASAARGFHQAFAVVEPSGELVAFARMDGISYGSILAAQQKARTSARYRVATSEREEQLQAGRLAILSNDEVMAIGGGVPIVEGGRVVGALGVSGASAADDDAIAVAAVSAN
jgi:glc operon protein GlcG